MEDWNKPLLNKNGQPLKILMVSSHCCIRVIKEARALKKIGYSVHGLANRNSYGVGDAFETLGMWNNKKQLQNYIRETLDNWDIFMYANEPHEPAAWIREVIGDRKLIIDLHDLDGIRRSIIPIAEREMINAGDALIYVAKPIEDITNKLHTITKPTITLYSYCNKDHVMWSIDDLSKRRHIIYEGGANPPEDQAMCNMYPYRSLHDIIKHIVELGNEVHMYCGNITAFHSYADIGAVLYPPTLYDEMMVGLKKFKYGLLIFNNQDGKQDQVNYTTANKMFEYALCGLPSLTCWCPEMEKYVSKHNIGFVFKHIDEIGNCSSIEEQYQEKIQSIIEFNKNYYMENFIWKLEQLFSMLLDIPGKKIPDHIRELSEYEYGKEDTGKLLT